MGQERHLIISTNYQKIYIHGFFSFNSSIVFLDKISPIGVCYENVPKKYVAPVPALDLTTSRLSAFRNQCEHIGSFLSLGGHCTSAASVAASGAMRQRKLGSHTPPCHRRMVITTLFSVLLAALQRRLVLHRGGGGDEAKGWTHLQVSLTPSLGV